MEEGEEGAPAPGNRVLVADDTEDMRILLRHVLVAAGYVVAAEARDGEEALAMWQSQRAEGLRSVILDQRMPRMLGVEVARVILADDPAQHVVLFSAQLTDDIVAEARAIGVAACLSKDDVLDLPGLALDERTP